jgi:hypothetical protein
MDSQPIFEFVLWGLVFVGAYLLTLGFWLLVAYVYDKVTK